MKKEEILERSRNENKDMDLYEKDIQIQAGNIGAFAAVILATIFFVIQILVGGGMNYGLYAIVFSVPAVGNIIKSVRMKRTRELTVAIVYALATLACVFAHIYTLITTSAII